MSRLCRTRTPCMQDSSTWAPWVPNVLPLRSRCSPAVDSLQAKPSSRFFSASIGSLQPAMLRCFRLRVLVKNCLNDGGISLPFFVLNELWETFRCDRCVAQPRRRAPKSCKGAEFNITVHNYVKQVLLAVLLYNININSC